MTRAAGLPVVTPRLLAAGVYEEQLTTFTGDDNPYGIDTAAAGAVSGRGIVVGGAYGGKTATV